MPNIDLSILNQRQTPAFYADTLANRPAAGFVGRIFVSTDTFAFYRDNGTTWDLIGGPGTGTITGSGANGQVSYWNGASTITGSNDLFFDAVNGHLGIGTITPGTALDVKHDQSTVVQLEQVTATNDIRIAFINSGVGLWRLGSFYNAGANDFGLFDIAAATQPVTVKRTTGQVLIGTSTVGSGKLVVASSTGDNGVQIVGASAPSLRIDNAESGPTKRAGFGISTATNNFIQGSADRDFCMFNGSTTASPILFGIYDTTNVQEAARISAARNFLLGTTTDAGFKLDVNGIARISGNITTGALLLSATTLYGVGNVGLVNRSADTTLYMTSAVSGFILLDNSQNTMYQATPTSHSWNTSNTLKLRLNNDGNLGLGTTPNAWGNNFRAYEGYNYLAMYSSPSGAGNSGISWNCYNDNTNWRYIYTGGSAMRYLINESNHSWFISAAGFAGGVVSFTQAMTLNSSTGNLLIGTTTDAGQKLQVNGSGLFNNNLLVGETPNSGGDNIVRISNTGATLFFTRSVLELVSGGGLTGHVRLVYGTNAMYVGTTTNSILNFITNNVVRASISNTGVFNLAGIPTSAAGLSSGDVWSNLGILNIVP